MRNETLFSLGNGYLDWRGNFEEGWRGSVETGLEGTYINGFFESEPIPNGEIAYGYAEKSQTMLNVANAKAIRLFLDDEEFHMLTGTLLEYRRALNLRTGLLTRNLVWRSGRGRTVRIRIDWLVALDNKYLAAISYEVTPLDFDGEIRLVSLIEGAVANLATGKDARLWIGLGHYSETKGNKFCINCVTGPDEYTALVNNNCYTNQLWTRSNVTMSIMSGHYS